MNDWQHRIIETNRIRMHVVEAGRGPLVILCHGFPETWYSWRHQIAALSAAGYRVVAPDQRGYGGSDAPEPVEAYDLCHLAGDIVGLVYALGEDRAALVGHDWGAAVAWTCALLRPDMFRSVCLLSVPYVPFSAGGLKPTDQMKQLAGAGQFYQLYFQQPGRAEAELEQDVSLSLRKMLVAGSGNAQEGRGFPFVFEASQRFIDAMPEPESLPPWLTQQDLDSMTADFQRTGFRGGLNWYRNLDRNPEMLAALQNARIQQPSLFLAGEKDIVIKMYRPFFDALEQTMPGLVEKRLIPGIGHWVQQEAPEEIDRALIAFLQRQQMAAGTSG